MGYTRNSDLSYYDSNFYDANCGSYALRLNEWYELDSSFEDVTGWYIDDWIIEKNKQGYSDYEISCLYTNILTDCLLEEFSNELELCDGTLPKTNNVELIAFSTFCYCGEKNNTDFDFHFKVFREGTWKEKCGTHKVRECELEDWRDYISDVVYFYHKLI